MSRYCVLVADGARARFFSLEDAPVGKGGPNLIEISDLVNPEAEASGRELWTDPKSGRNTAPLGAGAHGYDDHRYRHREESEHRFAKQLAAETLSILARNNSDELIVAVDQRMLGFLRETLTVPPTVRVNEVAKNLSKLSPQGLQEYLEEEGALPKRSVPV